MNTEETFDVDQIDFYEWGKPKGRTKKRLLEIKNLGLVEVGYGQFGYKGVVSGLYFEKIWTYSDEAFKDYMDWVKELINKSKDKEEFQLKKITEIKEKVPKVYTLPNGTYIGKWSGNSIIVYYGARTFELTTEESTTTTNKVVVTIKRGSMTFEEIDN